MATPIPSVVMALDVGARRVGVAIASREARLPRPLTTLDRSDNFFQALQDIVKNEGVETIVVGLPRGLQGQPTGQTKATTHFIETLRQRIALPVHRQDEAVTSKHAEAELRSRGKPYTRGDIDALAATYILEDFFTENQEIKK